MRNKIFLISLLILFSCSRNEQFIINGTIDLKTPQMIYLDEQGVTEIIPYDSAEVSPRGSFKLRGTTQYPRFFNLHRGDNQVIPLLIEPGEEIELNLTSLSFSSSYDVSGSEGSSYLKQLNDRLARSKAKLDSLAEVFSRTAAGDTETRQQLMEQYQAVIDQQRRYSIRFVLEHPHSLASLYALYQQIDNEFILNENRDIQLLKITGQSLDTLYPESRHVKALINDASRLEQQLKTSDFVRLMDDLESRMPDIALPDMNGDTVRLSSLTGKVVLLGFWASWSAKSIIQNAGLKEIYNKYHPRGFEIFQVSLDNDREAWERAVRFDELPWINVSDLSYPDSYAASLYNISALPTTFLLNRDGEFVTKDPDRTELEQKLDDLLSN